MSPYRTAPPTPCCRQALVYRTQLSVDRFFIHNCGHAKQPCSPPPLLQLHLTWCRDMNFELKGRASREDKERGGLPRTEWWRDSSSVLDTVLRRSKEAPCSDFVPALLSEGVRCEQHGNTQDTEQGDETLRSG